MKLTDYLAIYGAILSTAVFFWNAARAMPRFKVRLTHATNQTDDGEFQIGMGISIQNPSSHDVHISNVSFLYPLRKPSLRQRVWHLIRYKSLPLSVGWCHSSLSNYEIDDECPVSIEPGKSHWIFVPENIVKKVMDGAHARHLKVVVQDALWRNKYSAKFVYELPGAKKVD